MGSLPGLWTGVATSKRRYFSKLGAVPQGSGGKLSQDGLVCGIHKRNEIYKYKVRCKWCFVAVLKRTCSM